MSRIIRLRHIFNISKTSKEQIEYKIKELLNLDKNYNPPYDLKEIINYTYELNKAILNNRSVFLILEKEPKNYDKGKNYYSLWYVNEFGEIIQFWGGDYYKLVGQIKQDKDTNMQRYLFASNAIGMSRALDAMEKFHYFFEKVTGTKIQFN